jgi:hypothetical protein
MELLKGDLVVDNGRILGRLQRWDIPPHLLGRRCPNCDQLIPVKSWDAHQAACRSVGWGHYRCSIGGFSSNATTKRRRPGIDAKIRALAKLL